MARLSARRAKEAHHVTVCCDIHANVTIAAD